MTLRVVLAQINLLVGDIEGNAKHVLECAERAADRQADLVVFPELTLTGYPPEDLLLRFEFSERVEAALKWILKQSSSVDLLLGYPKRTARGLYNTAGLLCEGEILGEYHKWLLPNYSVFDEKRYFAAGEQPLVIEVGGHRLGVTICEDIWYREPVTAAKKAGAELIVNLNASPFHTGKRIEREQLVGKRALENSVPVLYCNLVGGQDELVFDGGSFAVDKDGHLTYQAPFFVEIEPLLLLDQQGYIKASGQISHASQPDEEEAHIYQALVLGVRDYVQKNSFKGVLLGLSGGIDSALTLAIAVDALGAESVEVVLMPSRYTAEMSVRDALTEVETLKVAHRMISIEPVFEAFLNILQDEFGDLPQDTTEENIQARCRGIILMALSNKTGHMLLTTGNKSEMSVGYATLYGDMAGGFAPLKDVPKTLVYKLANYRNRQGEVIPISVIERPPSAELRADQQDSDSLPDYDILDAILWHYVEADQSIERIIARGFDADTVRSVIRMVDNNEYKRRQAPPGIKITRRAFGRDRRYPITNGV